MNNQAACSTSHLPPEAWFPTGNHQPPETELAVLVCNRCPIRKDCAKMVIDSLKPGALYPIKSGIYAGVRLAESGSYKENLPAQYEKLRVIAGIPASEPAEKAEMKPVKKLETADDVDEEVIRAALDIIQPPKRGEPIDWVELRNRLNRQGFDLGDHYISSAIRKIKREVAKARA